MSDEMEAWQLHVCALHWRLDKYSLYTIERLSILTRIIGASVSIERGADLFSF